jgi:hypothetical protein
MKLKSIEEEAADCRKAFEGFPVDGYTLHCHHEIIGETLTGPAEHRIAFILTQKSENERALRLRLFRPIPKEKLEADAEWRKADAEWRKADAAIGVLIHAHFCTPDCPWNGKTIFP